MSFDVSSADSARFGIILGWKDAFKVPVLPWVETFLPLLGLPEALVEQPSYLEGLHQQLDDEYSSAFTTDMRPVTPEADAQLICNLVSAALKELARRSSATVAADFELWALRHCVIPDLGTALRVWGNVLFHSCNFPRQKSDASPKVPPDVLIPHLSKLTDFFSREKYDWLEKEVCRLAPEPTEEEVECGLDISTYGLLVEEIVTHEWTIQSLQILANSLTQSECGDLAQWACELSNYLCLAPESLQGDSYLQVPSPWLNLPTIISRNGLQDSCDNDSRLAEGASNVLEAHDRTSDCLFPFTLPTFIPDRIMEIAAVNSITVAQLWQRFWGAAVKRFSVQGAAAATLNAADGPLSIEDLTVLGIGANVIWQIFTFWDDLWRDVVRES